MKTTQNKILSTHPLFLFVPVSALLTYHFTSRLLNGQWFIEGRRHHVFPTPIAALFFLGLTIFCGIGYTLYRNRIVMRLFGIPIRSFTWDQTCAAEYVTPKEKWQRPHVKFRIKPRNPGHPYRNLTVSIPERNADEILVALKECLGPIWMPTE